MPRTETTLLVRYHQLVQVLASLARSSHEVEAVVQEVHRQAGTLFPAHITLLALRQPDGDWCWELYREERRYTHHLPFYPEGLIESVLRGGSLCIPDFPAYLDKHPVRIRRVVDDRVVLEPGEEDGPPDRLALSMLFVPLEVRGQQTGVLSIQSYEARAFDGTDLEFLELLAQHVSIALENASLREDLGRLAHTDALTGLPNRRAFYHSVPLCLNKARQQGRELALVMLDVHEFKRINDSFGHQTGDEVLAEVGRVLQQTFPAPDAAFRLSGDEFALLVWEPEARLDMLATRLTHALRAADWPPGPGPICLQGGVAHPPPDGNIDDWLSLADTRMYHAKRRRIVGNQVDWGLDFGDDVHPGP
ncbi:sensor domain-containing diguanylate cyclase [Deinococcus marmoris]|uniref:sensor domain-containing diguanylate cyclase n=1 Tax=Deinococcus marmoris TaxID=249408 RepID=UPI00049767CE|nr:sensor domain-containing diguanylate cyclase [Deinococcus marmoris]